MKQKKMRTSYAKFVPTGYFDKGKFIEGKLKVLSDMDIVPSESELRDFYNCISPRQIEDVFRAVINSHWKEEKDNA